MTGGAKGSVVGLIVARGGSKRLPGKNLRPFLGAPLIAHTIAAARAAKRLDRVILSTEDPEIARTATAYGCEVPFMRPAKLAGDDTTSAAVALHALDTLEAQGARCGMVVLLQPTSPLRRPQDIDACVGRCLSTGAPACVTITRPATPAAHFGALEAGGGFDREDVARALNGRALAYLTGACYAIRAPALRAARSFLPAGVTTCEIPWMFGADIDSLEDFLVAESLAGLLSERCLGWTVRAEPLS